MSNKEDETVYVIGHQQPDTDAICSAIAYARFKQAQGMNAVPARCGPLNPETAFVLDRFGVEPPELLEDATGKRLILVDHNEYSQAVEGAEEADVVEVVDHHRLGDVETSEPVYVHIEPIGSTSTILAEMFDEVGVDIPDDVAGLLLSGMLSDTVVLRSPTTTEIDEAVVERLCDQLGMDAEAYGKELLQQKSKLGEKEPREIVLGDFKEFQFGEHHIGIGQVETVEPKAVLAQKDALLDAMRDVVEERGYTFLTLIVTDLLEEDSEALFAGDEGERFAAALDTALEYGQASLPGVMSRKKQVVPPLEDAFTS